MQAKKTKKKQQKRRILKNSSGNRERKKGREREQQEARTEALAECGLWLHFLTELCVHFRFRLLLHNATKHQEAREAQQTKWRIRFASAQ